MKRILILFFLLQLIPNIFFSQSYTLKGIIKDKQNNPIPGAAVILFSPRDSSILKSGASEENGTFQFQSILRKRFLLKVNYIGMKPFRKFIQLEDSVTVIPDIILEEEETTLKTVNITGKIDPSAQKGDTSVYNANAFKTGPDANTEDLLTKMPGITTENGKVKAQGEDVKQVLVDGKPFFGDDPSSVLKNLPAEVVDKIQVFDRKSDQSQFTGFDDGNASKTINIITKAQFRNGTFGRIYAGAGPDERYKAGATVNFFRDKRRITIMSQTNNINEQNFSQEDLLGVMSTGGGQGGGMRGMMGGGMRGGGRGGRGGGQGNDASQFLIDQKNGISLTHAIGLNYSDKWGSKTDVSASYFFNYTDNTTGNDLVRNYITGKESGLIYAENSIANSINQNHRFNMRLEFKFDSLNSIVLSPKASFQSNEGNSELRGENSAGITQVSKTRNDFKSTLFGGSYSMGILFRHYFAKKGRTLSVNATPGYSNNRGNSRLFSLTDYLTDTLNADSIDQKSFLNKYTNSLSSNITYTEPINDYHSLSLSYIGQYNSNNSDKQTRKLNLFSLEHSILDSSLSNVFINNYLSHAGGLSYRYQKEKSTLTIGADVQIASLQNDQSFPKVANLKKDFFSVLPNAMYMFRMGSQKNIRVFYRTSNTPPLIDQLQEVVNNSNPLQLSVGNSNLKQDYQHQLTGRYSSVNAEKGSSFFFLLGGSIKNNGIANSTFIAEKDTVILDVLLRQGSQLSKPVNIDGTMSFRTFLSYGIPLRKIRCNLNMNAGFTFSRTPGLINNEMNYADAPSYIGGFVISSNLGEKFDFSLSTNSSYSIIENSLQSNLNSAFLNQTSRIRLNVMPWKGLVLSADLNHSYYEGLNSSLNSSFTLLNAGIGYKFLKDRKGELRLTAFDLLKQNLALTRNTSETYYEDVKSNVLQQYFLLTFTYTLKQFQEKKEK